MNACSMLIETGICTHLRYSQYYLNFQDFMQENAISLEFVFKDLNVEVLVYSLC